MALKPLKNKDFSIAEIAKIGLAVKRSGVQVPYSPPLAKPLLAVFAAGVLFFSFLIFASL